MVTLYIFAIRARLKKILFLYFAILQSRGISELYRYHQYRFADLRDVRVNGPGTLNAVEDA